MHADWWVAPHPGTDTASALGMLHVIIADGLVDEGFALAHSCAPLLCAYSTPGADLREAELHAGAPSGSSSGMEAVTVPVADGESPPPCSTASTPRPGIPVKTAYRLLREVVAGYTPIGRR